VTCWPNRCSSTATPCFAQVYGNLSNDAMWAMFYRELDAYARRPAMGPMCSSAVLERLAARPNLPRDLRDTLALIDLRPEQRRGGRPTTLVHLIISRHVRRRGNGWDRGAQAAQQYDHFVVVCDVVISPIVRIQPRAAASASILAS